MDASLAFKWIVDEEYADEAKSMLLLWQSTDTLIAAPSLFFYEIVNALYRRVRRGDFTLREVTAAFANFGWLAYKSRPSPRMLTSELWNLPTDLAFRLLTTLTT